MAGFLGGHSIQIHVATHAGRFGAGKMRKPFKGVGKCLVSLMVLSYLTNVQKWQKVRCSTIYHH